MEFEKTVLRSYPTGSRYICNPPVMDTDNDTVVLVNGFYDWQEMLRAEGWEPCDDGQYAPGDFRAWRKGEENYIVTESEDFFLRYIYATEAAKALNLTNKEDRVKLFIAVEQASEGIIGLIGGNRGPNVRPWEGDPVEHIDGFPVEFPHEPMPAEPPMPLWVQPINRPDNRIVIAGMPVQAVNVLEDNDPFFIGEEEINF